MHMNKIKESKIDQAVKFFSYGILTIFGLIMLYPFLNLIAVAFSPYEDFLKNPLMVFAKRISLDAFRYVFASGMLWRTYLNTIIITIVGTGLSVTLTSLMAYPLSKDFLKGRGFVTIMMIFTMLFSGGMIPTFLLIKNIGLYNSIWALILPSLLSPYNVILTMSFFRAMPHSLEEAAYIDGAGEGMTLIKIILPLSKPILSTISLFVAVTYWNSYFSGILYIKDRVKWPLQLFLREILLAADNLALSTGGNMAEMGNNSVPITSVRYATVIVVMLPILCVYPFLQKYFAKGVMLGSIKG